MREIKFRAWFVEDKVKPMDGQAMSFMEDRALGVFLCDIACAAEEHGLKYILMQYTGLKDRNGAEVYEGDVVRGHLTYEESKGGQVDPLVGHISWNEYWCKWVISGCWGQDDNYDGLDNQIEDGSFYGEIIGNIYEDAEFVKYRGNNGN